MKNKILTSLKRKGRIILWDKMINTYIDVLYDNIIYKFYLCNYNKDNYELKIKYNNNFFNILTSNLLKARIGTIVGKYTCKYDIEYAKYIFELHGYKLLETNYSDSKTKMKGITKECYYFYISLDKLKQNNKPCLFGNGNPYTITNIKLWLNIHNKDIKLISNHYTNQKTKLKFYCKIHDEEFFMTLDNILQEKGCKKCGYESYSGDKHYNYNSNLTNEERMFGRNYIGKDNYNNWRISVLKRDNYTCQCCGKYGIKTNVHHLDGYNWCKEGRLDINNGITLCEYCHKEFHCLYGNKNNTYKQFLEYITDLHFIYSII